MSQAWSQSSISVMRNLGTSQRFGLSGKQLVIVKSKYGLNVLNVAGKAGQWKLVLRQLQNPMVYILTSAAVIAAFLGEHLDSMAILAIVFINSLVGYIQESKAEAAITALKKLTVPKARVLREGKTQTVDSAEVFPGDILLLEAGDYIVADARIVEAFQLKADESVLTGESFPVEKHTDVIQDEVELADRMNMLFAGTAIAAGSGRAVVTATGMETQLGRVAGLLQSTEAEATPMQIRLEKVSYKLLIVGLIVISIIVILGLIQGEAWFNILMTGISLSVAAIPEGLPTVVTLTLALGVRRMTKRHALVRNLSAVETLGSTDVICTDKTGTLTTGKMRVREVFTLEEGISDVQNFIGNKYFFHAAVLCNNASLDDGGSGDTTEIALLLMAKEHDISISKIKDDYSRIHEWSFESDRKRMSVAVQDGELIRIFCKGAPESLLSLCKLSDVERNKIETAVVELSGKGRRTLALAHKEENPHDISKKEHLDIERDFYFLGLVAIADPPKEETISSIQACKSAGIKVAMITGDHPITAHAIAKELGILKEGDFETILTGKEIDLLSVEELAALVEKTSVFARVTPEHKLKIIDAFQDNGHVVAMTGDGVNDAPALKKASIGVAMGKAGTEVARQASSIVLTDDNFSTIAAAVEEGRAIYGNIRRTIQYLFSTNLAEIFIMLGAAILGLPVPLTPLGLLWINLVTDGFPSLALAAEPVGKNLLKSTEGPSPKSFFDKLFMKEMIYVAVIMTVIELYVYIYILKTSDVISARSYAFTLLVYLCLFRSFSCRSETKTFFELPLNFWHLASVIFPIGLQMLVQSTSLFEKLFKVRGLSLQENMILFILGLTPVTVVEVLKLWRRK